MAFLHYKTTGKKPDIEPLNADHHQKCWLSRFLSGTDLYHSVCLDKHSFDPNINGGYRPPGKAKLLVVDLNSFHLTFETFTFIQYPVLREMNSKTIS